MANVHVNKYAKEARIARLQHQHDDALAEARRAREAEKPPHELEPIDTFPPVPAGLVPVDIIHFNDFHRQLDPIREYDGGGAARVAGTIHELMREYPHAIVVNLGDVAYDTGPITGRRSFEPIPQLFKAMGVSILELGNHEFQDPNNDYAALKDGLLSKFNGDVLCSNVVQADNGQPLSHVKPFVVKQLQGFNIAFVGVVTQDMATSAHPAVGYGLTVADIGKTLSNLVPQVRQQGADAVVVMAHDSVPRMSKVAAQQDGMDVILAAHDHKATHDAVRIPCASGHVTPITEAGSHGTYVGHTRLLMDPKTHQVVRVESRLIPVDTRSPSDPEVARMVTEYLTG